MPRSSPAKRSFSPARASREQSRLSEDNLGPAWQVKSPRRASSPARVKSSPAAAQARPKSKPKPGFPTFEERTRRLKSLAAQAPALVSSYKLSCFAYSVTGVFYLLRLPHLPPAYQTTPLCSGPVLALLLILQGCCSFAHDAPFTFGVRSWMGLPLGPWLSWVDRALATTLTVTGEGFVASGHTDCRAVLPTLTAPFMTIFSTHDEQFFKRKDVEAYHAKVGSDLIGEANEELVVWETDAEGGKCGHMVPFENPKEFVACVVRNIAKAKTDNV